MEPSEKFKAKKLAKTGPKFFKIQKNQFYEWGHEKLWQNNNFLLKQAKNHFVSLAVGFWGSSKPKKETSKQTK